MCGTETEPVLVAQPASIPASPFSAAVCQAADPPVALTTREIPPPQNAATTSTAVEQESDQGLAGNNSREPNAEALTAEVEGLRQQLAQRQETIDSLTARIERAKQVVNQALAAAQEKEDQLRRWVSLLSVIVMCG